MKHIRAVLAGLVLLILSTVEAHAVASGSIICTGVSANFQSITCPDINEELTNANNRGIIRLGSVAGTNTITANAAPYALTSYDDGQHFTLKPAITNTGAVTLNVSGVGGKAVVTQSGGALIAGDLVATTLYTLVYYGPDDHFRVKGAVGAVGGADDDIPEAGDFSNLTLTGDVTSIATVTSIAGQVIGLPELDIVTGDTPANGECLSYDNVTGGGTFNFIPCSAGGGGDSITVETGDNTGAFVAATDAAFEDSADIDFTLNTVPTPDEITGTVRPNAVALTTDTTGNYAAGDAEAGAALTGDSATAFFSTGTLEFTLLPAATTGAQGAAALATAAEALAGTNTTKATTPAAVGALWLKGAPVASAGTITLGDGGVFHITGTTTITDIDFTVATDGRRAILIFDGALTLTHNATTLVIPGGANITTAAGDVAVVVQDSGDNIKVAGFARQAAAPPSGTNTGDQTIQLTGDVQGTGSGSFGTTIQPNAVALSVDTTGSYVDNVADGTGIDGTATVEGSTYTPIFDATELSTLTWGSGAGFTWTFNSGASEDPQLIFGIGSITVNSTPATSPPTLGIADEGDLRFLEELAGGTNYISFKAPTAIGTNRQCVLVDGAAPIPDSCVGDGVDGGGGGADGLGPDGDKGDVSVGGTGTTLTIDPDSVALTTDTTGNYAAGDAEAGAALTGDSATAFFSTGTLEIARGGNGSAPGGDDQTLVSSSTTAGAWATIPDSDAAGTILGYDQATNAFTTKTDDDVPEAGDFGTLALTGDVTSSGLATTIAANSVAMPGDTTGNYVGTVTAGTGVAVTGADAENATKTAAFDFSDAGASPTLGADEGRFTSNATVPGNLVFEGDTADTIETRIAITEPTTADKTFTIPNADSVAVQPFTCTGSDKISSISALGVVSCTVDAGGGGATLADGDYTDIVVSGTGTIMNIDANAVGSPEIATDAVSADELNATGVEAELEAVIELADLQGDLALTTKTSGNYVAAVGDGTGIDISGAAGEGATQTPNLDLTEIATATFGAGTFTTMIWDAGASDPTATFGSGSVTWSNVTAFNLGTSAVLTSGNIELNHASANTLTAASGVLSIEGVALLTATSGDALFLTPSEGNAAYQPLDADLTSWALISRASGFDTFATTASSTNLRGVITDEVGTGAAMFGLISTMTDDLACTGSQVVRRNAGDTAFECATISAGGGDVVGPGSAVNLNVAVFSGTTGKLIADGGATVAALTDDIPEAGDFGALSATAPITQSGGTISTSIATGRLVGRTTASAGVMEEITPNATLSLTAGGLGVVDVTCTGCLGPTEIAGLDAGDITSGTFADARVDGSLEADELTLAGDVTGLANANSIAADAVGEPELDFVTGDTPADGDCVVVRPGGTGGTLEAITCPGAGGGISNVVEDTTPQLGGALDLNSFDITGTGNINITGAVTASTNVTATAGDVSLGDDVLFTAATGGALNWNAGDVTLTHTATDTLSMAGGTFVLGHTAALNLGSSPLVQSLGTGSNVGFGAVRFTNAAGNPSRHVLGKSRNASVGGNTALVSGDQIGEFLYVGNNGTDYGESSSIVGLIDGTVSTTAMPGRLSFNTSPSGTESPTEKWTIRAAGGLEPGADATYDIGSATVGINDLHFGSGGILNFDGGDCLITHTTDTLTLSGCTAVGFAAAGGGIVAADIDTSAELAAIVTDETGTGALVFGTAPDLTISATTETNIENAIDTLANLTSIQGQTVTMSGALIRSGAHSLTLTTTGTTSLTLPTSGTVATTTNVTDKPESFCLALSDETTTITTGDNKVTWNIPYAFTLTNVYAYVNTVSTSGLVTVDLNEDPDAEGGTAEAAILSTKITIDANERRSSTAATAPVISDTAIAAQAELSADVDVAGTGAKGLKVCLVGHQ